MKTFTDIEQSMKLKEILSIENADMYWLNRHIDLTETKYEIFVVDKSNKYIDFFKSYAVAVDNNEIIPCWSLAALLSLLKRPTLHQTNDGKWYCDIIDNRTYFSKHYDNPVDALYEMILKLHEQKSK